jgi:hypothetical protein
MFKIYVDNYEFIYKPMVKNNFSKFVIVFRLKHKL